MEMKEIREILKLLEKHDITDFTLQRGDHRIRVRRGGAVFEREVAVPVKTAPSPGMVPPPSPVEAPAAQPETLAVGEKQFVVTSPIVGTFYRAPSPESPPYVDVGQTVSKGTVLCIVEAMKIMNEIESEVNGKISAILVENAQPVEYGEPLFIIDLA
ncbi:MAG: acetyl-CoA carboxylase biotin carboxyl carrier protein [bacterium]|nr:MAG: acetyl-CoA carboxylase biotin carboxyl carrier protein [bacterium]